MHVLTQPFLCCPNCRYCSEKINKTVAFDKVAARTISFTVEHVNASELMRIMSRLIAIHFDESFEVLCRSLRKYQ